MSGGGGPPKPPDTSPSGGEFLLKLLQKPPSLSSAIPVSSFSDYPSPNHHDPAVAAVGPSIPFPPWPAPEMRPFFVPYPNTHPHGPWPLPGALDLQHLHKSQSFSENSGGGGQRPGFLPPNFGHQPPPPRNGVSPDTTLIFGSLRCDLMGQNGLTFGRSGMESQLHGSESIKRSVARPTGPNRYFPDVNGINQPRAEVNSHGPNELNHPPHRRQNDSKQQSVPFRRSGGAEPRKGKEMGQWVDNGKGRGEHNMGNERMLMNRQSSKNNESHLPLTVQLDRPGLQQGSKLHSAPAADIEESSASVHSGEVMREKDMGREGDSLSEQLMGGLAVREKSVSKPRERALNGSRNMDARSDFSGVHQVRGHQIRNRRREIECRNDIERLTHSFLSTYESLKPAEEEKDKQKQLLASLEKLVVKEWPKAQLFLYGSCANSFGVSHSDIDVCLAIDEKDTSKADILLKLADILQSDNLQNVQALTRARVPIVKLMDPVTGICCDICINNVLAVVNTKLLRDYAQIDARLRQLAFIVKHWAKLRGVNETYRGTLSSYAYVLMCIHFLQQRKPAILPCLQEMDATYMVTIDEIECAFFDNVESLRDFGAPNKESIAKLLWAFFDYWAFRHDYANAVISVRTGTIISKREKDWTRRIGNDRHLICIEDPFEISHDLGRVVDKYSIKILREEFERAAYILQHDPNPSITLFEPYVPVERGT